MFKPSLSRSSAHPLLLSVVMIWLAFPGSAFAQYKYVAADGSVTYSDRPAPADAKSIVGIRPNGAITTAPNDDLPFATKQAQGKYPITIYTGADCQPCASMKSHLVKRGVPFTEKTLRNSADNTVFKSLGFADSSLPAITVGNQRQSGFEAAALDSLLDLAGYPKGAKLPAGYQAKVETLTPEPVAKVQIRVAEANGAPTDSKAAPKKEAAAPAKPKEPAIRF